MGYDIYYNGELNFRDELTLEQIEFIQKLEDEDFEGIEIAPELYKLKTEEERADYGPKVYNQLRQRLEAWKKEHPAAAPVDRWPVCFQDGQLNPPDDSIRFPIDEFAEMLTWFIENYVKPWNNQLDGDIYWDGEEIGDTGAIVVKENVVTIEENMTVTATQWQTAKALAELLKSLSPESAPYQDFVNAWK